MSHPHIACSQAYYYYYLMTHHLFVSVGEYGGALALLLASIAVQVCHTLLTKVCPRPNPPARSPASPAPHPHTSRRTAQQRQRPLLQLWR